MEIASPALRRRGTGVTRFVPRARISPRLAIYVSSTVLAVLTAYLMGKDMGFDTLNYHFYAGFSALHNRFGQDYFAAGPTSYLNPYIYVPFYLLATSGLPALAVAGILAVGQSAILWLTFEIALEVFPAASARARIAMAVCALALAFANPILINQFGSSYADVTTAEVVLGGWLLLLRAINSPSILRVACAGLLLGAASALKLTNSAHALSALPLVLFIPGDRRTRVRCAVFFCAGMAVAFVAVCAVWSIQLERSFGNPVFPLLNGIFHSPQYPTQSILDHRFTPDSVGEALRRPFALLSPASMVDDEVPAADIRYALLLSLAVVSLLGWTRNRVGRIRIRAPAPRTLVALGCGFLIDWTVWLCVSGNGRYFIAMACIAAVLVIALLHRLFADWPRVRNCIVAGIFFLQGMLLSMGAALGNHVPWDGGAWFDVRVPTALGKAPALYFAYGESSNSFIAPFLSKGSGVINLGGAYALGPDGANGARVDSAIRRYEPRLRVLLRDPRQGAGGKVAFPQFVYANDALESFGLRADPTDCASIAVRDVAPGVATGYLLSCGLVPDASDEAAQSAGRHAVDLVFNRLEDACPAVFYPRRPATESLFSERHGQVWMRQYADTGLMALVRDGIVQIADRTRGGPVISVGRESSWLRAPLALKCWRHDERYFAHLTRAEP